jgi:flagellar protein FliO/FliZ
MRIPAWRLALVAALACLASLPIQATEAVATPQPSQETYAVSDRPDPATSPSPSPSPSRPPSPDINALGRMLGYLTLFAAIAGAAIYFVKFGLPLARKASAAERKLQILETRPLGNRQYLLVVAYDETRMLIGVTPGKIDYLCPLESLGSPKDFSAMMASAEKQNPTS